MGGFLGPLVIVFFIVVLMLDWGFAPIAADISNAKPGSPSAKPKRMKKKRSHPPPLPGYTCESSMGFEKYKDWFTKNGETLCEPDSPSQITCSSRIGRYAFFCVGYNIISLSLDKNEEIVKSRISFYNRKANIKQYEKQLDPRLIGVEQRNMQRNTLYFNNSIAKPISYFNQDVQPGSNDPTRKYNLFGRNHFVAGCIPKKGKFDNIEVLREFVKMTPPEGPLRTGHMIFNVELFNTLKSDSSTMLSKYPFTYVASGDCATGNPGHCIADPHHLLIMQKVLDKTKDQTSVILYSGFGKNNYIKNASEDIALIEDWWPFVHPQRISKSLEGNTFLPILGLSAQGWNGPHWRHYTDYGDCNRTSDILLEARMEIMKYWALKDRKSLWPLNAVSASSAEKTTFTGTGLSQQQQQQQSQQRQQRSNSESLLGSSVNSGARPRKWRLLWLIRNVKDRIILNINQTIAAIEKNFSNDVSCESVDLGQLSYQDQLKKTLESDIIIAMHGGAAVQVAR